MRCVQKRVSDRAVLRWMGCFILVLGTLGSSRAETAVFNFENDGGELAVDSGSMGLDIPFLGTSLRMTETEAARFGGAGMALGDGPMMGFSTSLASYDPFAESITRMTIVAWLKARTFSIGEKVVYILQRLNSSSSEGNFLFTYSGASKRFNLLVGLQEPKKNVQVTSERTPDWQEGEWVHVAMVFDNGGVAFYLNGEMVGSPLMLSDGVVEIPGIENPSHGILRALVSSPGISYADDIGLFLNAALGADDIHLIYEQGLDRFHNKQ